MFRATSFISNGLDNKWSGQHQISNVVNQHISPQHHHLFYISKVVIVPRQAAIINMSGRSTVQDDSKLPRDSGEVPSS